jgi:hypothetical protein
MLYLLLVFINVYRCPTRIPYQMMFVSFNTGFLTILTRRVPLVEHELLTLPVHLSPAGFSGVLVTRSLVLCVCFVDRVLSFCPFSFGHCVFFLSSIYGFSLPLTHLQILLSSNTISVTCWTGTVDTSRAPECISVYLSVMLSVHLHLYPF